MTLFEDLMWPDASIYDGGIFVRATRRLGSIVSASATARLDFVHADADTASDFFITNAGPDLDKSETNVSGAVTLSAAVHSNWTLSAGVGSAVRTADASERYSDRIPASKAQTSAEFVGNPLLDPERSTQGDLWVQGNYRLVSLQLNAFLRHMSDYITLTPTTLPKRLPLSPNTVFQYVNGEANFWGVEGSVDIALTSSVSLCVGAAYLRGKDNTEGIVEPALGVAPFKIDAGLRYDHWNGAFHVEGLVHGAADQNRVSAIRDESSTDGYVTADLRGGIRAIPGVAFRLGVLNLLDEDYVDHLNAENPFTQTQLAEPGRVFFLDAVFSF
jgi:iron complex outermembrane receptor protein